MAASTTLRPVRKALGLYTQFNRMALPEGALVVAKNVEITREGLVSKRRGFNRHGDALAALGKKIFEYDGSLIVNTASALYRYDAGSWTPWEGSFTAPSGYKMRSMEMNGVLLFSTNDGIYRTDALTTSPVRAGIPGGLAPTLAASGTGGGWLIGDRSVGYRVVWGRSDARDNLLLGAPSFRETLTNTSWNDQSVTTSGTTATVTSTAHGLTTGDTIVVSDSDDTSEIANGTYAITVSDVDTFTFTCTGAGVEGAHTIDWYKAFDVTLTIPVPQDIQAGDFFEVYRTTLANTTTATDPGDRLYRLYRGGVTASDILDRQTGLSATRAATTMSVTQTAHGYSTGDEITVFAYTTFATPPVLGTYTITVDDADTYHYTDGVSASESGTLSILHGGTIQLIDIWDDYFLGVELYTNANRESLQKVNTRPPLARDVASWKGHPWYANTERADAVLLQLIDVTGVADDTDYVKLTVGGSAELTFTFSTAEDFVNHKFKRYTTGTDAENVRDTAKSLCRAINSTGQNTLVYAYYVSGINDPPGYIVFEARVLAETTIAVTTNSGLPSGIFSPELPTSGDDVSSSRDVGLNRLYHGKLFEPEAVPDLDYEEIGGRTNIIKRILPLRDSLIVLTSEGVWRVSGESENTFNYLMLDPTVSIRAPEAAVVLGNSVYCLSTQGVVRITESGTIIVSRPIEEELKDLFDETSYEAYTHAVAYESERKYMLFTALDSRTRVYTYNYLTKGWSTMYPGAESAHVLRDTDTLYLAHLSDLYILQERKNWYAQTDYRDETTTQAIDTVTTTVNDDGETVTVIRITWNLSASSRAPAAGDQVYQSGVGSANIVTSTDLTGSGTSRQYELELDRQVAFTASICSVHYAIDSRVEWAPEVFGNPMVLKHFQNAQVYLEGASAAPDIAPWQYLLGFTSDLDVTERWAKVYERTTLVGGTVLRTMVPLECQRARALNMIFRHNRVGEPFAIAGCQIAGSITGETTTTRR